VRCALWLGAASLLCASAAARPVRAQAAAVGSERVVLEWNRPAGSTCIGRADVARQVEAQLGRSVFVREDASALHISGDIEQRAGSWIATLHVDQPGTAIHGVRQLRQDGGDCAALTPSLIVVLATLIGMAQPESDRSPEPNVVVGLAGALGFGVLPEPAFGGSAWFGVMLARDWLLWLDATGWLPQQKLDALGRGGTFDAWQAGLSLCRTFYAGARIGFAGCAGGQLGGISGEGRGLAPNRNSERLLAQSGLEAALSIRLFSSLALRTSATGAIDLARPSFFLELPDGRHRELFHVPLFAASLRAGLALELP
jgi:hypothetical protein